MTGKEIIIYILQHGLENEDVAFMSVEEAAVLYKVGSATIRAWFETGLLKGFQTCDGKIVLFKPVNNKRRAL